MSAKPSVADTPPEHRYPSIGDYALIGDCHSAALVSRQGSIDWCCMPSMGSASSFGRILDWDSAGHFQVAPADPDTDASRTYLEGTVVLETTYRATTGVVRVLDCFTVHPGGGTEPYRQLLRVVEGVRGHVDMSVVIAARFDYGAAQPWIRRHGTRLWSAVAGNDALVIAAGLELEVRDVHDLSGSTRVSTGERLRIVVTSYRPEELDDDPPEQPDDTELDRRLDETIHWWRDWVKPLTFEGTDAAAVNRSAMVLKTLTNAPTGAIAAAPTTSLPEAIGADRNWDYRYSWIRDSQFTVRSLTELGCDAEADGFRRFIERTAAGSPEPTELQRCKTTPRVGSRHGLVARVAPGRLHPDVGGLYGGWVPNLPRT